MKWGSSSAWSILSVYRKITHLTILVVIGKSTLSFASFLASSSRHPEGVCRRNALQILQLHEHKEDHMSRRDILSLFGPAVISSGALWHTSLVAEASTEMRYANSNTLDVPTTSTINSDYTIIPYSSVRRYKTIRLSNNGLRVLLVSDQRTQRSQCALTVNGAGQFSDPSDLPGLAHLMEHIILSYNSKSTFRLSRDFEEWLSDREGASNAFTAYQKVCFHFSCPFSEFPEALERFASLFVAESVESVCRDKPTLYREIRRVNAELDFENPIVQEECVAKAFVNLEHPYSKFLRGSLETLETIPNSNGVDVGERLVDFFRWHYLPKEAILVVIGPQEISALERWIFPFSFCLSQSRQQEARIKFYLGQFLQGRRNKHVIMYRKDESQFEKLSIQWVLNNDYQDMVKSSSKQSVTAPQIAFVLSQILGRRGPGSLYSFLQRRGWTPSSSNAVPRLTIPVDTSGFQVVKLDILLTLEGFLNRSYIVAAVYDCIETLRYGNNYVIPREIMAQYAVVAKLFGYVFAPRPPDAIELAFDAQVYGLSAVQSGRWYRFPSSEDRGGLGLNPLRRALSEALIMMRDPANAVIIISAGEKAVSASRSVVLSETLPAISSGRWITEPVSGARIIFEDFLQFKSISKQVLTRIINREELIKPVFNPLIPTTVQLATADRSSILSATRETNPIFFRKSTLTSGRNSRTVRWTLLDPMPGEVDRLLPRGPPEPGIRCVFVIELLSPRPARANVRQAARAELWKLAFDMALSDLAELGASGGLAYDVSFNKFGLRLSFLGIRQTLPSYTRRIARILAVLQSELLDGPETLPGEIASSAISMVFKAPGLSPARRRLIISNLRSSTAYEVSSEGISFLRSVTGVIAFGDGLPSSTFMGLVGDVQDILKNSVGNGIPNPSTNTVNPSVADLLYKPTWKPRYASSCSVSGASLISDACGRIPR